MSDVNIKYNASIENRTSARSFTFENGTGVFLAPGLSSVSQEDYKKLSLNSEFKILKDKGIFEIVKSVAPATPEIKAMLEPEEEEIQTPEEIAPSEIDTSETHVPVQGVATSTKVKKAPAA